MRFQRIFVFVMIFFAAALPVTAAKGAILFVPHDDRPVSFEQTLETVQSAKQTVLPAPKGLLGNRDFSGDPDGLWKWVFENAKTADAAVLSSDALLYGSLVSSRKHAYDAADVMRRVENFQRLHEMYPNLNLYVFGSIMRTPRASGSEEPGYYAQYGPQIFSMTALWDKEETEGLTRTERKQLKKLEQAVPEAAIEDWMSRREKNFSANQALVDYAKNGVFRYLALGRDDNAPYSQTHKESRKLQAYAEGLSVAQFQTLSGIDEMALVMLTRAVNDRSWNLPFVAVRYADGMGEKTVPTYSDEAIGISIRSHLAAAGAIPVRTTQRADLVLMVNTAFDGVTGEANFPSNTTAPRKNTKRFVDGIEAYLQAGYPVAVADISYGNGADNALMAELEKRDLLTRLATYSGWNTANNSAGFAIGQGILSDKIPVAHKKYLLAIRMLDDWAYQANVRQSVAAQLPQIGGGNYSQLDAALEPVIQLAETQLNDFAAEHMKAFHIQKVSVDFPWNRMFEADVSVE